jgi:hypothetical protein
MMMLIKKTPIDSPNKKISMEIFLNHCFVFLNFQQAVLKV